MDIFEIMRVVLTWQNLLALIIGGFYGLVIGILPGIGGSAGMALAFPLIINLHPLTALIFMASLYRVSNYGGSITAIMLNTPGDSSNAATILDGFPMCEKGQSGVALGISATGAAVGGTLGVIVLILFTPILAEFALKFGPAEYFLVAIFALSIISAVIKGATIKGLISAVLGLLFATVGYDIMAGHPRFTFGMYFLEDGVPFIQALVGFFAISQALSLSETTLAISKVGKLAGSFWQGFKIYFKHPTVIVRSTLVGLWLGVLPAVGQATSGLVAYADAVRSSRHPETFGKGEPAGVVASETSTNACMPGDLVCTIALGIPGSVGAAVFLSIMIVFGVIPGPLIFTEKADVISGLFFSMILIQIFVLVIGFTVARYIARISLIPNEVIVPAIIVVSLLGSYAIRNMMVDVILSVAFGFLGYIMRKAGYNPIPLILGLVLGAMVEENFHRALKISKGSYFIFFSSPISKLLVILIILSLTSPYIGPLFRKAYAATRGKWAH
ncbi:MAG: tripartite tricarboxylate transporter permease [Thermodesulfobacteriota bacterium]